MKKKYAWIIIGVVILLLAAAAYYFWPMLTDRPTLMYFRSPTCPYCKQMAPVMNGVKRDYGRRVHFVYVDVSTPQGKALAREHGAMGTPTFLLFDREGNEIYRLQGVQPRQTLDRILDDALTAE